MKSTLVVLTDFSPAAAQARAYAAVLAAPLGAEIHLVQVFFPPVMSPEVGMVMLAANARDTEETRRALNKLAAEMPVPATVELLENGWDGAVAEVLARYRPLLLITGLTATSGFFDELFSNRTLSLAHDTGYPLLLVPQHLPAAARHPPRRLVIAVKDRAFHLASEARAVAPLLDALAPTITTVCVLPLDNPDGGWNGLQAVRQSGLAAAIADTQPHTVLNPIGGATADGIRRAVRELDADMLALLDPGHGWVDKLFDGSIIDQVLRDTQVPVLLLAARVAPSEM